MEVINDFVLNMDAIMRIGGLPSLEKCDEDNMIYSAIHEARKKFGVHFDGDESFNLIDNDGKYLASTMPIRH